MLKAYSVFKPTNKAHGQAKIPLDKVLQNKVIGNEINILEVVVF